MHNLTDADAKRTAKYLNIIFFLVLVPHAKQFSKVDSPTLLDGYSQLFHILTGGDRHTYTYQKLYVVMTMSKNPQQPKDLNLGPFNNQLNALLN